MLQVNGCRYYTHTPTTSTPTHQASPLFIALSLSLSKLLPSSSSSSSSSSSLITMASSLQSLAFSSPVSHCPHQTRFLSGMAAGAVHRSARSPFSGQPLRLQRSCWAASRRSSQIPTLSIMMVKPTIQFIQGTDEQTIPDVKLTKSRDGTNGMAIFRFEQPSVFDSSSELGDITGFFMIDEEGVLQSVDVSAKFINGKPAAIEAKYVMRTPRDWDRFMRFMERYANKNGLQFVKK